jgi:hypothetical protein
MNITQRLARYIALPALSAGIIGGAALGLAGTASAGTYPEHDQTPRTGLVAAPTVTAPPAIAAHPGKRYGKIIESTPVFGE